MPACEFRLAEPLAALSVATDLPALADGWSCPAAEVADRLVRMVAATPWPRRAYQRV